MSLRLPLAVRVTSRTLVPNDAFAASVLCAVRPTRGDAAYALAAFAFKNDEKGFARELLARHTKVWLYRSNQRAFCGDFLAVDMSSPAPAKRRAFAIELKLGSSLRFGSGGVQLKNAEAALRDIARGGVLGDDRRFDTVTGDAGAVLAFVGCSKGHGA